MRLLKPLQVYCLVANGKGEISVCLIVESQEANIQHLNEQYEKQGIVLQKTQAGLSLIHWDIRRCRGKAQSDFQDSVIAACLNKVSF